MKHGFKRTMLALSLALIISIPTQTFAVEKTTLNSLIQNNSYNITCSQLTKTSMDKLQKYFKQYKSGKISKAKLKKIVKKTVIPKNVKAPAPITNITKPTTTTNPNTNTTPVSSIGNYEQQVLDLVNKERNAAGLSALTMNTKLASVAEKKAEDMRDKGYFSHTSPTYGSPFDMMKKFGITYTSAGENIAKGQKTPTDVMKGWMNSPGHKANILNSKYTEIGVGYVTDSSGNTYWVQMFIRP